MTTFWLTATVLGLVTGIPLHPKQEICTLEDQPHGLHGKSGSSLLQTGVRSSWMPSVWGSAAATSLLTPQERQTEASFDDTPRSERAREADAVATKTEPLAFVQESAVEAPVSDSENWPEEVPVIGFTGPVRSLRRVVVNLDED
eukprot:CAMPEP_0204275062 /NCGR_PEP_ID=MMETSP0468-20130131/25540_1 /ASSEMBLY_ACC=CAM_ASM_000383 /TAXON_ID=2969 /ORGANISM="Oxyrrhis marina" /LENGTH=143 /DNA_ID=CAMNT_0051251349 /DNA_START=97 /DNA_END=528 /DNA_ORIENTATION=-